MQVRDNHKYMEIHNCSKHITKTRCSICHKDMSHKLAIKDYFNKLDKALCQ